MPEEKHHLPLIPISRRVQWVLAATLVFVSCSSATEESTDLATSSPTATQLTSLGGFDCAYNHAYQENYENDKIDTIVNEASGCYVLVDPDEMSDPVPQISLIRAENEVGCYMSAGTGEDWRGDYEELKPGLAETEWDEWPGEYFVTNPELVLPIMLRRIARLGDLGCQWVEYDNMDWDFDEARRLAYAEALCDATHDAGMLCMAKNSTLGARTFDGLTLESYTFEMDWWEAEEATATLDDGEPVLLVHYDDPACATAEATYRTKYGDAFVFLCEDPAIGGYQHTVGG